MVFKVPKPSEDLLDIIINTVQPNNPHILDLASKINNFYMEQSQSKEDAEERESCVNMIKEYIKSDGITRQIESQGIKIRCLTVFGSFATQCASKNSDLDLCVCATYETKKRPLPVTVLQSIYRDLTFNPESKFFFGGYKIHNISFVQTAKIPIIRFNMNNISVDMSASFEKHPPRSSLAARYINAYCQLDERFKVLVTFLKHWLKSEGHPTTHLRDYPNSYSIILMLIHVLQWFDILPNLHKTHKEMFHPKNYITWSSVDIGHEFKFPLDENTIALHRKRRSRNYSIVQLLYLFACQYSEVTIMRFYRFNMRSGDLEERSPMGGAIEIVDVFDSRNPGRTAHSVFDLMGATDYLRKMLAYPGCGMFEAVLKITSEKKYLYPMFPYPSYPLMFNIAPSQYNAYEHRELHHVPQDVQNPPQQKPQHDIRRNRNNSSMVLQNRTSADTR
ncbi:unnamed protein product [Caenorhabditis brenneri]